MRASGPPAGVAGWFLGWRWVGIRGSVARGRDGECVGGGREGCEKDKEEDDEVAEVVMMVIRAE